MVEIEDRSRVSLDGRCQRYPIATTIRGTYHEAQGNVEIITAQRVHTLEDNNATIICERVRLTTWCDADGDAASA